MKKDFLNSIVAIALMFLVGGCMTMVLVYTSQTDDLRSLKPKKEKIRSLSNASVVNNNQTPTPVNKLDTIRHTEEAQNKATCDTTKRKAGQDQKPADDREPSPALK